MGGYKMLDKYSGKVIKLGKDIDTNDIIPTRFLMYTDPEILAKNLFCEVDPDFVKRVSPGNILVAGSNFGCGSSREHAAVALKAAGISVVVAESFARIFFRNSIAIGLPVVECTGVSDLCEEGDELEVDVYQSIVYAKGQVLEGLKYPEFILDILEYQGLTNWIAEKRDQILKR